MGELLQDAWFYSREGEPLGPVSLAELRAMAMAGTLNPRRDLVWTPGMAEWRAAGEIADLFEHGVSEAPPLANPYTPPPLESVTSLMRREDSWPGASRRAYLCACLLLPALAYAALIYGPGLLTSPPDPAQFDKITCAAALALCLIGLYYGLQRLANLGMSRWWYLGHGVPILNLWVGYRCFACPAGYAYHKKLDGAGIALAICYWLLLLLILLGLVALGVILTRYGDDAQVTEWLRSLREAVEQGLPAVPGH